MMETNKVILQKLKCSSDDNYSLAEKYYSILSAINNLKLTAREIQLIAFTAVRGNMSYANVREDFCKRYNTTSPTINNIISKLKKVGVLIKDKGKIKVNPVILIPFDNDIKMEINIVHKQE